MHGPFGKTHMPKVSKECITSEDLSNHPSVIFIPFYLWTVICKGINLNKLKTAKQGETVGVESEEDPKKGGEKAV
jgi:hypothetical protein